MKAPSGEKLPITPQGYEELKSKIKAVKEEFEKMPAIIAAARAQGDLKENAEYHAARERQGLLNADLQKMNSALMQSRIIDPVSLPKDIVTFGKLVEIQEIGSKDRETYTLVGPAEVDGGKNHISIVSLMARGLLGKKVNEVASVSVPSGEKQYKIIRVACQS